MSVLSGLCLCGTFLELGDAVSRNLALAHQDDCHISYGEETITESCLLEIHRRHSKIVKIKTFTKRDEAINGADWEWHLVGSIYTFKMRVQAKRLARGASRFSKLLTYRAKGAKDRQIRMLIKDAKTHSLYPAICLYSPDSAKKKWKAQPSKPYANLEFGCHIGDAAKVKTNDHASLERLCLPWHHLVCPKPVADQRKPWTGATLPNIRALNGEGGDAEGRGISRTPPDWALGAGIDHSASYVERGIMGVMQIDGRGIG